MNDLPNTVPTPVTASAVVVAPRPNYFPIASYILNGVLVLALLLVLVAHRPMGPGFRPRGEAEDGARAFMKGLSLGQALSMEHHRPFFGRSEGEDRPPMFRGENSRETDGDFDRGPGMFHPGEPRGMDEERGDFRRDGMMDERGPGRHEMGLEHHDPVQMAEHRLDHMSEWLSLTDAEKAQIKPLLIAQDQQLEKIHQDAHRAEAQARQNSEAQIKALLTPDQQKLLPAAPGVPPVPAPEVK